MIDSPVDSPRDGAEDRPYSRWPDPWPREDEWGPLTAAVMFFIILGDLSSTAAALIVNLTLVT